jgi:hypothetical protein
MKQHPVKLWLVVIALSVLAAVLAPPVSAAGRQLVVRVSEPFEVNGQLHPAGRLSLREVSEFSPVATLNEVRLDGRSLGVVFARVDADRTRAPRDEVIFERSERGHLVLASMALRGQPLRRLCRHGLSDDEREPEQPPMLARRR